MAVCVFSLTVCYLKLGLGHDAACDSEGLADIIPCIWALQRWNGQLSIHRHRNTAISLCRLVGKQKILQGVKVGNIVNTVGWHTCSKPKVYNLSNGYKIISFFLSCLSWYLIMYFQSKCEKLPAILSFAQKWWSKYCSQCSPSFEQILLTNLVSYKLR